MLEEYILWSLALLIFVPTIFNLIDILWYIYDNQREVKEDFKEAPLSIIWSLVFLILISFVPIINILMIVNSCYICKKL